MYLRVVIKTFFGNVRNIYINEGAHVKWAVKLAAIAPSKKVILHVRILEDIARIPKKLPQNFQVITISKFMLDKFPNSKQVIMMYDAFEFANQITLSKKNEKLIVGIIGRVSMNKGLNEFYSLIKFVHEKNPKLKEEIGFTFFGHEGHDINSQRFIDELKATYSSYCEFAGFVSTKDIYSQIDVVLHLSQIEPLGRIFFEALNENKPLVGAKSGGIGELSQLFKFEMTMVNMSSPEWKKEILKILKDIQQNYNKYQSEVLVKKDRGRLLFSQKRYNKSLEKTSIKFLNL